MTLTDEQLDIVNCPVEAKLLVTAGPGTGKTYTLIARLAKLICDHEIAPGQEMLVLSFSRAAVTEIRNRCADFGGDLSYVNVITFDSYATRLLSLIQPDGAWTLEGFDGRIEHAVGAIQSDQANDFLSDLRHVFVDEIQDLVGIRAELIKALLVKVDSGFSLFGDPAQGIYNFSLEDPIAREIGSAALYEWVRKTFRPVMLERHLSKNHRALSKASKIALWAGSELNHEEPNYQSIYDRLQSNVLDLPKFGDQKDLAQKLKKARGKTAILCRKNGHALMLSRELRRDGLEHLLARGAEDRFIPSWVSVILSLSNVPVLGKNSFKEFCLAEGFDEAKAESNWQLLKKTESGVGNSLDLFRLNSNCRRSVIPDWLNEEPDDQLVVSSIHRAKGREFDNVLVAICPQDQDEEEHFGEEARALYVALTRPKRSLYLQNLQKYWGLKLYEPYQRWIRTGTGVNGWKVTNIEVKFSDIDRLEPPRSAAGRGHTSAEIQDYIEENVHRGDAVDFRRVGANSGRFDAVYDIVHNGFIVGKTDPKFAGDVLSIIRKHWQNGKLPSEVGPLPVEGIETVFGDPGIAEAAGLPSPAGVWLSVRVAGMGQLRFKGNE